MFFFRKALIVFLFYGASNLSGMGCFVDSMVNLAQAKFLWKKLPEPYNQIAFSKTMFLGLFHTDFSEIGIHEKYQPLMKALFFTYLFINDEYQTITDITNNIITGQMYSDDNKKLCKKLLYESLTTGTVITTRYLLFLLRDVVV